MKILFIEPCHVGFGGYFRATNICSNLAKKEIYVDFLLASEKKFSFGKKTKVNKYLTQYELPRFYFHFFLNGRILRGLIGLCFGLFKKYDLIHACVPVQLESNIPAFFLKLMGKKVVMDWDDYWEKSLIYGEHKIMKKYVSFCERRAPKFFENMVVVSDLLNDLSKKRGAKKVLKLINGVNLQQFKPATSKIACRKKLGLNQDGNYFLAFGNTYNSDRALLLCKLFEKILEKVPEAKLLFNKNAFSLLREQGFQDQIKKSTFNNIIETGYILNDDLPYYLKASDASIFLIGDYDNERANFPIRIGTYLLGESIVIMNDINSEAGNTIKKYNCGIVEKNISTLAKKTVELLNHNQLQKKLHKNIIKAKMKLSWDNQIGKLIKFYEEVIKHIK
jgi:glycosyltransferase involved in cell wall biosynthesis